MLKQILYLLLVIIGLFVLWFLIIYPKPEIVILEGWEHGVAICNQPIESTPRERVKVGKDYGVHWTEDHIYYMINYGHERSEEVKKLVELAKTTCNN